LDLAHRNEYHLHEVHALHPHTELGYGTEPEGTIHSTGWAVIAAIRSKSRS